MLSGRRVLYLMNLLDGRVKFFEKFDRKYFLCLTVYVYFFESSSLSLLNIFKKERCLVSNSYCRTRLKFPSHIRKFEFSDCPNIGYIIEGKSGHFLTSTFNYERRNYLEHSHMHNAGVVKRLLAGEIKIQTPKKLYPAKLRINGVEITDKAFSWKGLASL